VPVLMIGNNTFNIKVEFSLQNDLPLPLAIFLLVLLAEVIDDQLLVLTDDI